MKKYLITKINLKDWWHLGQWVEPPIFVELWSYWGETKSTKKMMHHKCNSNMIFFDGHYYFWQKSMEEAYSKSYKDACNHSFSIHKRLVKVNKKIVNDFLDLERKLRKIEEFGMQEMKLFFNLLKELDSPWFLVFPVANGIEKSFQEEACKYHLDYSKVEYALEPTKFPMNIKQQKEAVYFINIFRQKRIIDILKNEKTKAIIEILENKNPILLQKMKKHVNRYEWVNMHHFYGGTRLTLSGLVSDMKRKHKGQSIFDQRKKQYIPNKIKETANSIKELTFWRFACIEACSRLIFYIMPQLKRLSRQLGVNYNDFIWFTKDEIINAIKEDLKLNTLTAKNRRNGFGIIKIEKNKEIITGIKLLKLRKVFFEKRGKLENCINGTIASKGIAKGKVKKIFKPDDIRNFLNGEILVAPETAPSFVPAMKKAAAIVTDIGGLTSHAAIISRELRKPCITATKIATKVLKDGDLVEVDADKGIVTILK